MKRKIFFVIPAFNEAGMITKVIRQVQKAGYRALFVPGAVGYHRVSHTFGGGRYSEEYAKHKARNWFVFLRRHGPLWHQAAFFLLSAPVLIGRLVVREVSRGNIRAVRGMLRGLLALAGRRA